MTLHTKQIIDELMRELERMFGGDVYVKRTEADKVRDLLYRLADSIKQDAIEP